MNCGFQGKENIKDIPHKVSQDCEVQELREGKRRYMPGIVYKDFKQIK